MKIQYVDHIIPNAYHGTTLVRAKSICRDGKFNVSRGKDKFLGDGIYFYEGSRWHGFQWAKRNNPCVCLGIIRACIQLGKCLDLHNYEYVLLLKHIRRELHRKKIPKLTDAVVINFYATKERFDTVRATYTVASPGSMPSKIFPESRYHEFSQLIICVRNQRNILNLELVWEGSKYHV